MRSLAQAIIQDDYCPYKERLASRYTQRKDDKKIKGERSHLQGCQAKKRDPNETKAVGTLVMDFSKTPKLQGNKIL